MADSILFNLASKTLAILASPALEEFRLAWNVKQDIVKLGNTLSMIRSVILDAEEQEALNNNSRGVKEWVARLKDVVYDVDDLLDNFATESLLRKSRSGEKARRRKVRIFFSKSNPLAFSFKMGHRIKDLRERLDAISDDRNKFQFNERLPNPQTNNSSRETCSFVREEEVIGREVDKKKIIDFLLGNCSSSNSDLVNKRKRNVYVVSVVGVGGLGKTALAQLVYNDELVRKHFELKIWVCVSDDDIDVKKIGEKILGDGATTHNNRQLEQVQQDVREKMCRKRYLLVLDDIWDENHQTWLNLKSLLLEDGAEGSMVIVTTRSENVARITSSDFIHRIQGLDDQQSWELFSLLAFDNQGGEEINHHHPKQQLVEIGKEIVKKCVGVPLAIRAIASHLYTQDSESYWSYFKDNELSKINMKGNDDILPILKLSYDHLPSHLKSCFAYCSLFPKDFEINRDTLIQLWMAQGFIQCENNRCLDDVGNEYFTDLLLRSFFQDVTRDEDGVIVSFKLHDLMHDLSKKIAGNECTTIGDITTSSVINIDASTRHLSLVLPRDLDSLWKGPDALLKTTKLRTFHILRGYYRSEGQPKSVCDSLLSTRGGLLCSRVLDLKGLLSKEGLPSSIGMLKHLRYLNLSHNESIEFLPPCIAMLLNLQTLDLTWCTNLKQLPRELRRLTNLRHLKLKGCRSLRYMPYKLGELTSLQTLSMFVLDNKESYMHGGTSKFKSGIRELSGLNNLRGELCIKGLEHMRCRGSSDDDDTTEEDIKAVKLHEKQYLGSIKFIWSDLSPENEDKDEIVLQGLQPHPNVKVLNIDGFGGERLSGWDSFCSLSKLVGITFFNCSRLQKLPPLHQFPHLKRLVLYKLSALEYIEDNSVVNDDDDGTTCISSSSSSSPLFFPSLQTLYLYDMPNLKGWWRSSNSKQVLPPRSFSCLSELWIKNCPNLTSIPPHPSVEEFEFSGASVQIVQQSLEQPLLAAHSSSSFTNSQPSRSLRRVRISKLLSSGISADSWNFNTLLPDEEGILLLNSIQQLRLLYCRRLKSLSGVVQQLTTLQVLEVKDCDELDLCVDENNSDYGRYWSKLKCLHTLTFKGIPKLVSLPEGIQHIATLQNLEIKYCASFESLPEWIGNIVQLQKLTIRGCLRFASLPQGMKNLTCLRELVIYGCHPDLEGRCNSDTGGVDWPKIAHVPRVYI